MMTKAHNISVFTEICLAKKLNYTTVCFNNKITSMWLVLVSYYYKKEIAI